MSGSAVEASGVTRARRIEPITVGVVALVAVWLARFGVRPVSDPDAWLHLRIGSFLNDGGTFVERPDPWSSGSTYTYVPTQWLSERLGAASYQVFGGLGGVAALRSVGIVLLLATLWYAMRGVADREPAGLAMITAMVGSTAAMAERPQLLSLAIFSLFVGAWFRTLHDNRARWWLVPTMWLWACVHGLRVVGLALSVCFVAAAALDRRRVDRRLVTLLALLLLAVAVTPLGPRLLLSPLRVAGSASGLVSEWQALSTANPLLLLSLVPGVVTALIWWRGPRPAWSRILLLAVAVGASFTMARLVVVGGILMSILMAEALQTLRRVPRVTPTGREIVTVSTLAITSAVAVGLTAILTEREPASSVPTALAQPLSSERAGSIVLAEHGLTGWLMWTAPDLKYVVDLRAEIFTPETIEHYADALAGRPGWTAFVDDQDVALMVLGKESPLLAQLDPGTWELRGANGEYVLLRRTVAPQ